MSYVLITESHLDDIADAIRSMLNVENTYRPADMATAIGDVTYRGAVSASLSGTTHSYIIPAGYHNGSGTVTADVATMAEVKAYLGIS